MLCYSFETNDRARKRCGGDFYTNYTVISILYDITPLSCFIILCYNKRYFNKRSYKRYFVAKLDNSTIILKFYKKVSKIRHSSNVVFCLTYAKIYANGQYISLALHSLSRMRNYVFVYRRYLNVILIRRVCLRDSLPRGLG